jgi:tRNA(fMet)-specific endonuclease VapC
LRGQLDLRQKIQPDEGLGITTISVGELTHGAYKSANPIKNIARVDVLLSALTIFPFDLQASLRFGRLKAELEKAGMKLPDADLQIAAIALAQSLPLATHNQKHFQRVPDLQLEDWLV